MKRWERIAAISLFLIGVGGAIGAWQIGFGTFQAPGPGFFPFWLASLLALLSLVFFVRNLGEDVIPVALWAKGSWIRPLKAACVMFVYVLLIGRLGFISSSALLFVAWLRIVELNGLPIKRHQRITGCRGVVLRIGLHAISSSSRRKAVSRSSAAVQGDSTLTGAARV